MFSITTELSIYYSIICILLGLIYAYFLYRKNKFFNKQLTLLLFFSRLLVVSFLAFLLLNPLFSVTSTIEEKPIIVLAQDASHSTSLDSLDYQKFINLRNRLSSDFDVISYNYSDQIKEGFTTNKTGSSTNINQLLDKVDLRYSGRNLAGVVLSWDGQFDAKSQSPIDHNLAKATPIYTIPLGDTSILKDVRITKIRYNKESFLETVSPLRVNIKTEKCKGEIITIKLYSESKLIDSKELKINSNDEFFETEFQIKNSSLGLHKYTVVVSSVSNEKFTKNNSRSFYVEVLDSKYKILILYDAIHPDISAIKSVLDKNKYYEIDKEKILDFNSNYDKYNLVIYFSSSSDNSTNGDKLAKLKNSNTSLLLFVSPNDISTLNYLYPSGKIVESNKTQEVYPRYNTNFSKFNISSNLQNYLTDLPPLLAPFSFRDYNQSLTSDVLLYQKIGMYSTENPLIILDNNPDRKFSVVYAEGLWKWKINDRNGDSWHQNFDELFSKIAQFLLVKEHKRIFSIDYKKEIIQGEKIQFEAKYYKEDIDDVSKEWEYNLNNEKDVTLQIKDTSGILIYDTVFSKKKNSSYFLKLDSLSVGSYIFTAKYNNAERMIKGEFTVLPKQEQIESKFYTANHDIVKNLSKESGVEGFDDFNINQIVSTLKDSPLNKIKHISSEEVRSIINNRLVLIFILLFILIEMVVRRYNGTY